MAPSPHDALFRYTFAQPEHAAGLLRTVLPEDVVAGLDWRTLALQSGTRLDRRLRRHQTDLLFAVDGRDGRCFVSIVVEHSSRVDGWTALRMLDYTVGLWRQMVREDATVRPLPAVFAIVLHHGAEPWTAATEFADLVTAEHRGAASTPRYRYAIRSLAGLAPDAIDALASTVLGKLTLAFLQFVPGAGPAALARVFRRWGGLVRRLLAAPSGTEAMRALSEYVLLTTSLEHDTVLEVVRDEMNREASEIMESTGQRLIRQGRLQGLQEGREEGREEGRLAGRRDLVARQLTRRFGPLQAAVAERLATAGADDLDRWAERLLDAPTLAAVFSPG